MPSIPRIMGMHGEDGVINSTGMDPSLAHVARNFIGYGVEYGRRRRGFQIQRAISATNVRYTEGIEHAFGSTATLLRIYHHDTSLYVDDGTTLSSVSTGWSASQPVVFVPYNDYLIAWQGATKRVTLRWSGSALVEEAFDLAAASTGSVAGSATAGSMAVGATYSFYAVQYNINTGRQSGPFLLGTVTLAAGQTSVQLTFPNAPADAQFTHFKTFRTQAGLATPLRLRTDAVSVAGTTVNDGTADTALFTNEVLPTSAFGDFFVGIPPAAAMSSSAFVNFKGMLIQPGFRGLWYHSQAGYSDRWSANYVFSSPLLGFDTAAMVETEGVLIIATSREILFVTGDGNYGSGPVAVSDFTVEVKSENYGAINPKCLIKSDTAVYGIGASGPFSLDGGGVRPLKVPIRIDRLNGAPGYYSPTTTGSNFASLAFNPFDRTLWCSLPLVGATAQVAAPESIVAVYPVDEVGVVSIFDLQISSFMGLGIRSFHGGSDPSMGFFGFDSYGNVIELGVGDYDGVNNTKVYTVASVTNVGTGLERITTTPALDAGTVPARGVRAVVIPLDSTLDPIAVSVVTNNGSTTCTLADASTDILEVGSTIIFGGILGWYETGAMMLTGSEDGGFGAAAMKVIAMFMRDLVYDEKDALTTTNWPLVYAQLKVDEGAWGPVVTVFNGSVFPSLGKQVAPQGTTRPQEGFSFRFRLFVPAASKPAGLYGAQYEINDPGISRGR